MYRKLSAMIRFFVSKSEKSICIYEHLLKVNEGITVEGSSVQQCASVLKMLQRREQKFMIVCRMVPFALR